MSISSLSTGSTTAYQTPLQKLEAELQAEVSNGTISSFDDSALSSALTDIDSAIKASQSSDQSGGTKLSPSDMQSKIDDLIQNEVSSGKLTSAQATELKGVFQAAFANGPGAASGDGTDATSSATDSSASATTSSSASSSTDASSISELLQQFLQALQSSLSNSSSTTSYNASGTSTTSDNSSQLSAVLIDYTT